jgi:glutaredoxin
MKAIVYFLPTSVDCRAAKKFFSENGIEFEDKNVEKPEFRNELVKKHHSLTLPTIIIGDEIILGFGINKDKISEKLNLERR